MRPALRRPRRAPRPVAGAPPRGRRGRPPRRTAVRRQPELGAALLSDVSFDDIREWILCHHERPDGRGYPRGLSGDQIPVEAKIVAIVDAYAAMTSERPYRVALDHAGSCEELRRCAGTQFDAEVVQAFLAAARLRPRRAAAAAA